MQYRNQYQIIHLFIKVAILKDVAETYFDSWLVWDNDMVIQFDALDRKLARIVMRSGSGGQASARGLTSWWWHDTGTTRAFGAGRDHLIIKLLTVTTTIKTDIRGEYLMPGSLVSDLMEGETRCN